MYRISNVKSRNDLADLLDIPVGKLTYILYVKEVNNYYKSFEIPKKTGGTREINAPHGDLKRLQRRLAEILQKYHNELIDNGQIKNYVSHAFEQDKSIITNAKIHRNKRYILNVDLENFFNSFHFGRVRGFFIKDKHFLLSEEVATIIAQLTCYNGSLPQGAPTSPIITNLICNILDSKIVKLAKQYRVDYSRYADDLSFSTNDNRFITNYAKFMDELNEIITYAGFSINAKKTRLTYKQSRQEVTGLVVNRKVGVVKEFCKETRAMADSLYRRGNFSINESDGCINQLEGRFAFINQVDKYNNKLAKKQINCRILNSREKQYQRFLFYKYFFFNNKPFIVTEGKTDISYIKAAIKKNYTDYPNLVRKVDNKFEYQVSFMTRTKRFRYFFNIALDGADSLQNIYNHYTGKNGYNNIAELLKKSILLCLQCLLY